MEICSWDWGALATFTGAGVALYISWQWKNQKASEVIANESKDIIYSLNEIVKVTDEMFYAFMGNTLKKEGEEYDQLQQNMWFRLETIYNLILIKKKCHDDKLLKLIESFKQASHLFRGKVNYALENKHKLSSEDINKQIVESFGDLKDVSRDLKNDLAMYALYKK